MLKLEKSYWYNVDYVCNEFGVWDYAEMVNQTLTVPLSDGSQIPIIQIEVGKAEEMFGVYSCTSGDNTVHINLKTIAQEETWTTNRTKNSHLPSKFAWVSYKFKLWPGIRYRLATALRYLCFLVSMVQIPMRRL